MILASYLVGIFIGMFLMHALLKSRISYHLNILDLPGGFAKLFGRKKPQFLS
jgi:hypothetical protein